MAGTLGGVSALLNFDSDERQAERLKIREEDHTYKRINDEISAPCPCLNALTNQGYLYVSIFLFTQPPFAFH